MQRYIASWLYRITRSVVNAYAWPQTTGASASPHHHLRCSSGDSHLVPVTCTRTYPLAERQTWWTWFTGGWYRPPRPSLYFHHLRWTCNNASFTIVSSDSNPPTAFPFISPHPVLYANICDPSVNKDVTMFVNQHLLSFISGTPGGGLALRHLLRVLSVSHDHDPSSSAVTLDVILHDLTERRFDHLDQIIRWDHVHPT